MKVLMFSDLQAKGTNADYKSSDDCRLGDIWKTFEWLNALVDEICPDLIVCLGDVFEVHTIVDIPALDCIVNGFRMLSRKREIIVLRGNHDIYSPNSRVDALACLDAIPGLTVMRDALIDENELSFIGFQDDPSYFTSLVEEGAPETVFFCHQPVLGAYVNKAFAEPGGVVPEVFGSCTVFCGHYHTPSVYGGIHFVGSSLYHDFRDGKEWPTVARGAWVYDTDARNKAFYRNPHCRIFVSREIQTQDEFDWLREYASYWPNIQARFIIDDSIDVPADIRLKSIVCIPTPKKKEDGPRSEIALDMNPDDAIKTYVQEHNGDGLCEDDLISVGKGLLHGTLASED